MLPADVLASLDEPIDDEEDDEPAEMGAHAKGTTSGGSRMSTGGGPGTGAGTGTGARITNSGVRAPATDPPLQPKTSGGVTHAGTTGARAFTDYLTGGVRTDAAGPSGAPPHDERGRPGSNPPPTAGPMGQFSSTLPREPPTVTLNEMQPPPPGPGVAPMAGLGLGPSAPMPSVLAPGDAARAVAHAIVTRATGALCIESQEGVRRAVFREGDLVTAASGVDAESLLAFLVARGDLPRDEVQRLFGKLPPFGRHAGAALVAHGYMRQDQLWIVLRAHAEWMLGRMILQSTGTALMEPEPPGRLRGEPSVFERLDGSGGVRRGDAPGRRAGRTRSPASAARRRASPTGTPRSSSTSARSSRAIAERIQNARGEPIQSLLDRSPEGGRGRGALRARSPRRRRDGPRRRRAAPAERCAAGGLRRRPRRGGRSAPASARACSSSKRGTTSPLLGVPRNATSYEVRRAFVDLRRAFEPAKDPHAADRGSERGRAEDRERAGRGVRDL